MMIPDSRNHKGEDFAKFAAEMAQLAKSPAMRPHLTSSERRRQEREAKRAEEDAKKQREEWAIEAKRRDDITAKWFDDNMKRIEPYAWEQFKKSQNPRWLSWMG